MLTNKDYIYKISRIVALLASPNEDEVMKAKITGSQNPELKALGEKMLSIMAP